MTDQQNPLTNPVFRFGMPMLTAVVVVVMAVFVVEDTTLRLLMGTVAAVDIIATPWVLGKVAEAEETETRSV